MNGCKDTFSKIFKQKEKFYSLKTYHTKQQLITVCKWINLGVAIFKV